jgi:hypothetical protein
VISREVDLVARGRTSHGVYIFMGKCYFDLRFLLLCLFRSVIMNKWLSSNKSTGGRWNASSHIFPLSGFFSPPHPLLE